jgi:hypothetical protein
MYDRGSNNGEVLLFLVNQIRDTILDYDRVELKTNIDETLLTMKFKIMKSWSK